MDTMRQKSQKKDAEHDASLAPSDPNHVAKWGGEFLIALDPGATSWWPVGESGSQTDLKVDWKPG